MTVLINLREMRRAKNIKQDELAQAVGVRQSMISGIETGRVNASLPVAQKIARHLGVPLDALVGEEQSEQSVEQAAGAESVNA
jgi:DNA-binding XRE family transcriptional regulator